MIAPWVKEEMKGANFSDKRLNKRLEIILSALADRPSASIPAACGGYKETAAAYRFFDNEKATFESPLDDGPRRGLFLHALVGFTPDGTPLGMVHATPYVRQDILASLARLRSLPLLFRLNAVRRASLIRWLAVIIFARAARP